jgi:hypothetical protein
MHVHGLRHTVTTMLAEAGVSAEDIAAVLGQRDSKIAQHYAEEADRSRLTKATIKKFQPLETRRRGREEQKRANAARFDGLICLETKKICGDHAKSLKILVAEEGLEPPTYGL